MPPPSRLIKTRVYINRFWAVDWVLDVAMPPGIQNLSDNRVLAVVLSPIVESNPVLINNRTSIATNQLNKPCDLEYCSSTGKRFTASDPWG